MKITKKALLAVAGVLGSTSGVFAQTSSGSTSTFLPKAVQDLFDLMGIGGVNTATFVTERVQFAIYFVLGLVILVAVVYSIMAGIKYIRSEGDPGKIEEAQKSIKAILMGIAAIFVGVLGIILIFVIFNQTATSPSLAQVCISAGNSVGCRRFTDKDINDEVVQWCEGVYKIASSKKDGDFIFPDGLLGGSASRISLEQLAIASGYKLPTTSDTVVLPATSGAAAIAISVIPKGTGDYVLLCINPISGGYIPVVN